MSQFSCNLKKIESIVCKIVINKTNEQHEHGSGVVVPSEDGKMNILTAKHCILGKKFDYNLEELSINILIKEKDDKYVNILLDNKDKENILFDDDEMNDTAIIVLDSNKNEVLSYIEFINLLDEKSIPLDCAFRGFPAPYNRGENNKPITIGMCKYVENNILTTITKLDNSVYDDTIYNLSGCSGGCVYTIYKDNLYIVGIVYEVEELFQRIKINSLGIYNKLLKDFDSEELKFENYYSNKDISFNSIEDEFEKSKASWLNDRYIPILHSAGYVENVCENIIQNQRVRIETEKSLRKISQVLNEICEMIDYYSKDDRFSTVIDEINILLSYWSNLKECTSNILYNIKNNIKLNEEIDLYEDIPINILFKIKEIERCNYEFYNARRLRKEIEKVINLSIEKELNNIIKIYNINYVIFLGEPGTGKTHALSNFVNTQLNNNSCSLLIQAKQFEEKLSWKEIMVNALDLDTSLNENDIWSALNNAAIRCENFKKEEDGNGEIACFEKFVICVDAIDECVKKENWLNRIREVEVICKKFTRLRFIFSSRPYVFKEEKIENKVNIPSNGDVSVGEIFDKYITYYSIKFQDEQLKKTIKWTIKTPFTLRLFCEYYKSQMIYNDKTIYVTVNKLLASKIDKIDFEINEKLNYAWAKSQYIIRNLLICLVDKLISVSKVKIGQDDFINVLDNNIQTRDLRQSEKVKILDCLCDYGLIYRTIEENKDDLLAMPNVYYEIAYQPLIDYLLAVKLSKIDFNKNKEFPEILEYRIGAQQLLALQLLEDDDVLVGRNDVWFNYYDKDELFKLQLFAIANVNTKKALSYKPFISELFRSNTNNLRTIINNLVMDVCKIPDHPFNGRFVHDMLMQYKTPVDRDIIWSTPEKMSYRNNEIWEGNNLCICTVNTNGLTKEDRYDGLSLIYAWMLTNLDNGIRQNIKSELTKWGIFNQKEFVELLKKGYETNDPQMKEELLLCAVGIIYSRRIQNSVLKELSDWILINIFADEKIQESKDAVVRFAGRVILEDAFKKGLIDDREIELARPPYKFHKSVDIEMNRNVIDTGKESYKPITGDLEWYVIKKAFDGFFEYDEELTEEEKEKRLEEYFLMREFYKEFMSSYMGDSSETNIEEEEEVEVEGKKKINDENKDIKREVNIDQYSSAVQKFLKKHAEINGKEKISPKAFALSVAIAYLYDKGWSEEKVEFINDKSIGYDIAICRQYMPATHGSKSRVMTTAEKYTWCAVNEIKGYLADRLPFYFYDENGKVKNMLKDYSMFLDISNNTFMFNEISNEEIDNDNFAPFLPNALNKSLDGVEDDKKESVVKWIDNAEFPDFYEWTRASEELMHKVSDTLNKSFTSLFNYTLVEEKKTHTDSILWINSYIISNDDYNIMKKQLKEQPSELYKLLVRSDSDGASSPNVRCYIDPVSLVVQDWITDLYDFEQVEYNMDNNKGSYKIYKTFSGICYEITTGEEYRKVPSKLMRNMLDIYSTDGIYYRDINNEIIGVNIKTGDLNIQRQELLYVDTEKLNKKLDDLNYKMFWVIKLLREPSIYVKDKYENFFYDRYCSWILTEEPIDKQLLCDEHKDY